SKDIVDQLKKILNQINEKDLIFSDSDDDAHGTGDGPGEGPGQEFVDEDLEEIELDEDQEILELDEDHDLEEVEDWDQDALELQDDEELEEIELDEDQEIQEIDEAFDDIQEIDGDMETIELQDDEELEEIEDPAGDLEEIELDEDQEIQEIDEEFDEIQEIDGDTETLELQDDEELEEVEELTGDQDIEEIQLEDEDALEEIEELDEDVEELELQDDEELEEVDELTDEEQEALEAFRDQQAMAEVFDASLGEADKQYNTYVKIPQGTYTIGSKKSLKNTLDLAPFEMDELHMGRYPVTNTIFELFIEKTGYVTTAERKGVGTVYFSRYKRGKKAAFWQKKAGSKEVEGAFWYQPNGPNSSLHGKRHHPVVQVSVEDAMAFASWIGRRLPSEAEWEAAAGTGNGNPYPWGDLFHVRALNIEESGVADTSPVDEFDVHANEFGLVDTLGNVMEWTMDTQSPPFNTRDTTPYCVAKGGGWNAASHVTVHSRALFKQGFTSNTIGFRCASEFF
ncbi:MAG: formylglycine-generating enzyme family protein, partial [Desulfovibrionales bacterium]|nr:formylglycine-generating enzyme family protein [Desulfovibrionales bacterium]